MSFNPANSFLPILGGLPFGFGGSGFPVTQDAVTFTTEPVAPQEGVRRQDVTTNLGMYGPFPPYDGYAGPHYGVCGFPGNVTGFDPAPALSVPIMWRMRAEPAIVLASFYLTFAPACSAGWSSEIVDDGGDPELAEVVKAAHAQDLLPIWYRAFPQASNACTSPTGYRRSCGADARIEGAQGRRKAPTRRKAASACCRSTCGRCCRWRRCCIGMITCASRAFRSARSFADPPTPSWR
jgi:hypothetical protein